MIFFAVTLGGGILRASAKERNGMRKKGVHNSDISVFYQNVKDNHNDSEENLVGIYLIGHKYEFRPQTPTTSHRCFTL